MSVDAATINNATVNNLVTFIQDQRKGIEDMMDVARKLGPTSQSGTTSEEAYEQSFEADTPPDLPGPTGSLQGLAMAFFGISYISLALVLALYVYYYTFSIKNTFLTLVACLFVGVLFIGLLQRFG